MQNKLLYLLFLPLLGATFPSTKEPEVLKEFITFRNSGVTVETFHDLLAFDAKSLPIPFAQTLTQAKAKVPSLRDLPLSGEIPILYLSPMRTIDVLPTTLPTNPGAGRFVLQLEVDLSRRATPPGSAKLLADAVVDVLRDRLTAMHNKDITDDQQQIASHTEQASNLRKQIDQTRKDLAASTTQLSTTGLRPDASLADLTTARSALDLDRLKTELDLAGLKARQEALQDALAKEADKAREAQKTDLTLKALSKAVDASREKFRRIQQMVNENAAPKADAEQAELALFYAQAQLAERTNSTGNSAEAMAHWNQQLIDASIDQREKIARLQSAAERLNSLGNAITALHDHQTLTKKLEFLSQELARAQDSITMYTQHLNSSRNSPPQITITPAN